MGKLAVGDVVLVHFPFSDLKSYKLRPALILAKTVGVDARIDFVQKYIKPIRDFFKFLEQKKQRKW